MKILALVCLAGVLLAVDAHANKFESMKECVAGKRVTTDDNKSGQIIGPDKWSPGLMCDILVDGTGKQESVIYWKLRLAGDVDHKPAAVNTGNYSCSTFTGGHMELRPTFDIRVTGPSSYTGIHDGKPGTFNYDKSRGADGAQGLVTFQSGSLTGIQANYAASGGGNFQMLRDGHPANITCTHDQH